MYVPLDRRCGISAAKQRRTGGLERSLLVTYRRSKPAADAKLGHDVFFFFRYFVEDVLHDRGTSRFDFCDFFFIFPLTAFDN